MRIKKRVDTLRQSRHAGVRKQLSGCFPCTNNKPWIKMSTDKTKVSKLVVFRLNTFRGLPLEKKQISLCE